MQLISLKLISLNLISLKLIPLKLINLISLNLISLKLIPLNLISLKLIPLKLISPVAQFARASKQFSDSWLDLLSNNQIQLRTPVNHLLFLLSLR